MDTPWHEQDDFWLTFYSQMFTENRWQAAVADIDNLLALTGVELNAAVLDLACGPGRHALEMARRGLWVTGVDRTASYLEIARRQALQESLHIEFVEADMRSFLRPAAFDLAVNLFTAFGYFESPEDDRQVAQNLYTSLRPGGILVMELMGKEVLARIYKERDWHEEEDGTIMLEERRIHSGWSWIENRWILLRDGERREFRLSHRLYSAQELTDLLCGVGFATAVPFGDLTGAPYDHTARRLVVMARKGSQTPVKEPG